VVHLYEGTVLVGDNVGDLGSNKANRINEDTIHKGQGRRLHLFVTEVQDVVRLKTHDRMPDFGLEQDARFQRGEAVMRHAGLDVSKDLEIAPQQELLQAQDVGHSGMLGVLGPEDLPCQFLLEWVIDCPRYISTSSSMRASVLPPEFGSPVNQTMNPISGHFFLVTNSPARRQESAKRLSLLMNLDVATSP
jgi:hypothetical protein